MWDGPPDGANRDRPGRHRLHPEDLPQMHFAKLTKAGYKGQPQVLDDLMTDPMHFEIVSMAPAPSRPRRADAVDYEKFTSVVKAPAICSCYATSSPCSHPS